MYRIQRRATPRSYKDYLGYLSHVFTVGLLLGLWVVVGQIQTGKVLAVQTASMKPLFKPGDALWIRPDVQTFSVGQVITYRSRLDPRELVSHRIVSVNLANQELVTQGDDLLQADPPIRKWDVLGRVDYVIPGGGRVLKFVYSWPGLAICIYVPAMIALLYEAWRLSNYSSRSSYRLTSSMQ